MIGRYKIMPFSSKRRSLSSWRARRFLERMPSFRSTTSLPITDNDTVNDSPFESDWRDSIEEKHESRDDLALMQFKLL